MARSDPDNGFSLGCKLGLQGPQPYVKTRSWCEHITFCFIALDVDAASNCRLHRSTVWDSLKEKQSWTQHLPNTGSSEGINATRALAKLAGITTADRVLDVGGGLGGSARLVRWSGFSLSNVRRKVRTRQPMAWA